MNKKIITRQEMSDIAKQIIKELPNKQIVTFSGPLGAGKTTLVQEVLKQMGVSKPVTSPTYTYVNVYKIQNGKTFYHFDLYRLNSVDEFIDLGFNEYLNQPNIWCFIEWPQVIDSLLDKQVVEVKLEHEADDKRAVSVILK